MISKKSCELVSIIVVNYNGRQFLPNFFDSVFKQTYTNFEVIMVDNNSKDDSISFTEKSFPKVKIIRNSVNSGYAGGNNLGFKKSKGDYILIINNDVTLAKDLIEKLLEAFEEIPKLGAVQPMVRLMEKKNKLDACGSFWTSSGFNYHYGIYKSCKLKKYNKPFSVYSLKGVCMLIPRRLINKIGLFDDDFWCYFEETDFCHRVWLAGYECWYYPKTYIFHKMGGTSGKKNQTFIQFHSFKNRLCSYIKNLGLKEFWKVVPLYLILNFAWCTVYVVKFRFSMSNAIIKAIFWNLRNFRKTFIKRKKIQQKIRAVKDSDFLIRTKKNPRLSYYYNYNNLEKYED